MNLALSLVSFPCFFPVQPVDQASVFIMLTPGSLGGQAFASLWAGVGLDLDVVVLPDLLGHCPALSAGQLACSQMDIVFTVEVKAGPMCLLFSLDETVTCQGIWAAFLQSYSE